MVYAIYMHWIANIFFSIMASLSLFFGAQQTPVTMPVIQATISEATSSAQSVGGEREAPLAVPVVGSGSVPFDSVTPPSAVVPNTVSVSELPLENPNRGIFNSDAPAGTPLPVVVPDQDNNLLPDGSYRACYSYNVGKCGCGGICTPKK